MLRFPDPPTDACHMRISTLGPMFHKGHLRFQTGHPWLMKCWPLVVQTEVWELLLCDVSRMEMLFRIQNSRNVRVRWSCAKEFANALQRAHRHHPGRLMSATI